MAFCIPRSWTGGLVGVFHREFRGLFWSALPLPILILCGGTRCIWTCYISPPPQPDSLLLCSLRFTLHSSLNSSPPPSTLQLRIPTSVLTWSATFIIEAHASPLCQPSLECSHSMISEYTVSLSSGSLCPASSVGSPLSFCNTNFNQCAIMRRRLTGLVCVEIRSQSTHAGWLYSNWPKQAGLNESFESHWSLTARRQWDR